jgi:hypothetical protein
MPNDANSIGWHEWLAFLSPDGQQQIVAFVRQAREERGANWIAEIQTDYPMLSYIVALVANYDAETAFDELQSQYSQWPLWIAKTKLITLHGLLRAEIDRPR